MATVGRVVSGAFRQSRRWLQSPDGVWLCTLLAAAAIVRIVLAHYIQVAPDLQAYETWGELLLQHPLQAYTYGVQNSQVWYFPNYPPLTMYMFAVVDVAYFGTAHVLGITVSHCACSPVFRPILLIPSTVTDLIQVTIIFVLARTKLSPALSAVVAATYAFSPAILLDDAGWGQTDNLGLLLAVAALLLAARQRAVWAGLMLGLALVLKPEPWIFIPLVLVYLFRWAGWRSALVCVGSMLGTALVLWSPYLLPPKPEILVWRTSAANAIQVAGPVATRNAYNLWWLLGAQHLNINAPYLGPLSAQMIGGALFASVLLVAGAGIWFDASAGRVWAAAALIALAFFDVGTLQYERYIFPAVGLFLLAALYERRYWAFYAAVSLTAFACLGATVLSQPYLALAQTHGVHRLGVILSSHAGTDFTALLNVAILLIAVWIYAWPPLLRAKMAWSARPGKRGSAPSAPRVLY